MEKKDKDGGKKKDGRVKSAVKALMKDSKLKDQAAAAAKAAAKASQRDILRHLAEQPNYDTDAVAAATGSDNAGIAMNVVKNIGKSVVAGAQAVKEYNEERERLDSEMREEALKKELADDEEERHEAMHSFDLAMQRYKDEEQEKVVKKEREDVLKRAALMKMDFEGYGAKLNKQRDEAMKRMEQEFDFINSNKQKRDKISKELSEVGSDNKTARAAMKRDLENNEMEWRKAMNKIHVLNYEKREIDRLISEYDDYKLEHERRVSEKLESERLVAEEEAARVKEEREEAERLHAERVKREREEKMEKERCEEERQEKRMRNARFYALCGAEPPDDLKDIVRGLVDSSYSPANMERVRNEVSYVDVDVNADAGNTDSQSEKLETGSVASPAKSRKSKSLTKRLSAGFRGTLSKFSRSGSRDDIASASAPVEKVETAELISVSQDEPVEAEKKAKPEAATKVAELEPISEPTEAPEAVKTDDGNDRWMSNQELLSSATARMDSLKLDPLGNDECIVSQDEKLARTKKAIESAMKETVSEGSSKDSKKTVTFNESSFESYSQSKPDPSVPFRRSRVTFTEESDSESMSPRDSYFDLRQPLPSDIEGSDTSSSKLPFWKKAVNSMFAIKQLNSEILREEQKCREIEEKKRREKCEEVYYDLELLERQKEESDMERQHEEEVRKRESEALRKYTGELREKRLEEVSIAEREFYKHRENTAVIKKQREELVTRSPETAWTFPIVDYGERSRKEEQLFRKLRKARDKLDMVEERIMLQDKIESSETKLTKEQMDVAMEKGHRIVTAEDWTNYNPREIYVNKAHNYHFVYANPKKQKRNEKVQYQLREEKFLDYEEDHLQTVKRIEEEDRRIREAAYRQDLREEEREAAVEEKERAIRAAKKARSDHQAMELCKAFGLSPEVSFFDTSSSSSFSSSTRPRSPSPCRDGGSSSMQFDAVANSWSTPGAQNVPDYSKWTAADHREAYRQGFEKHAENTEAIIKALRAAGNTRKANAAADLLARERVTEAEWQREAEKHDTW